MNTHEQLLAKFDSAYDLHKRTGISYQCCKKYWRTKRLPSPQFWRRIIGASRTSPIMADAQAYLMYDLATDMEDWT